ncbi:hypothetical protein [Desulfuromonas versatilis]|uniref:hypothetical protein n=1 Tax=Desulfuromonas versatilis TaxID=2802975 RepID=UPI001C84AAE8|nr:hypothetical protein [Desulfuromonas versatilis]
MNENLTPIACQQVLQQDASVFSIQWLDLPPELAERQPPQRLLASYLVHIRRFTCGLVRPVRTDAEVEFRLWRTPWSLLRFSLGPVESAQQPGEQLSLRICGGLLVQARSCNRGELVFSRRPQGEKTRIALLLADYCPLLLGGPEPSLLRKWLYRFTQAAIHKIVTVRFLRRVYRELAGAGACCRVVKVQVRCGEEI